MITCEVKRLGPNGGQLRERERLSQRKMETKRETGRQREVIGKEMKEGDTQKERMIQKR